EPVEDLLRDLEVNRLQVDPLVVRLAILPLTEQHRPVVDIEQFAIPTDFLDQDRVWLFLDLKLLDLRDVALDGIEPHLVDVRLDAWRTDLEFLPSLDGIDVIARSVLGRLVVGWPPLERDQRERDPVDVDMLRLQLS